MAVIPSKGRALERILVILVGAVFSLLFYNLFLVQQKKFAEVPMRLQEGSMVNLNGDQVGERLRQMLSQGYYFEDARDVNLVTTAVASGLMQAEDRIDNIGEINKRNYDVRADEAFEKGGPAFQKRVSVSRSIIGFSDADSNRFAEERISPPPLPAQVALDLGRRSISGTIRNDQGNGVPGVLVRLQMLLPADSMYSGQVPDTGMITETSPSVTREYVVDSSGTRKLQSLSAYARTGPNGDYSFTGLPHERAFRVLPLQPGFQFGGAKGTPSLKKDLRLTFTRAQHTLKLLSGKDFNTLKREGALIVRTPQQAITWYRVIWAVFLGSFLLLHLFLSWRLAAADQLVLPIVMLVTGLSLLTLLSLQDPLRDRFLGRTTLWYLALGLLGFFIVNLFDPKRFTPDSGLYRMFRIKDRSTANGWQWAALASVLALLTILFGTGPEGSGVKVNLFGFQPSEVIKFMVILFLAGFLTVHERFISEYTSFRKRWNFFYVALVAVLFTIFLFLVLGDIGPAIVVCFTFIILFSFSRGDFEFVIASVIFFVLAHWIISNVWIATAVAVLLAILLIAVKRKQLSEPSILALAVISCFLLIDRMPLLDRIIPGPVQRLTDRKAIWQDPWNNEVYGGDQVANGIWAMSGGGITGQGIGEGFGKNIPEAHTDMILPAMGEEFGLAGIISIFLLFLVYLHRSIIIGRQTGRPFLFYICAGIGISTFIQFLLIAGGSIGALPLSGIALPFMSYGGTSLIVNLVAAGMLLSASHVRGSRLQMDYITRQQDRNLVPGLAAACIGILLLTVSVSRYLFNNKKWVVQPALVADRSGARMFSYNPRIAVLMRHLQAGSVFDRNGLLLATSHPDRMMRQKDSLLVSGLQDHQLTTLSHKRLDRYYPYQEHMFFWTGDANTGVFSGANNGYFAEYALNAELRGFATPEVTYNVTAHRFREDHFLPAKIQEMVVARRDYSALAPLLLAGIYSKQVEAFRKQNRDVQLTMDASLQTQLQKALQSYAEVKDNRVSIVVMNDVSGDVLASAMYPLPPVNDWDLLTLSRAEQNQQSGWLNVGDPGFTHATQPGSTAKIATALAAFNKMGDDAKDRTFTISQQDLIRIKSDEPDETGTIGMGRAIIKSNNAYFIKLANEERLQEEMATVYLQTGMFLRGLGGYFYERNKDNSFQELEWRKTWRRTEFASINRYDPNDIRRTRGMGVSGMAWGQGELVATPAAVARLVSGVANNGMLIPNRYVLKIKDSALGGKPGIRIANQPLYAERLTGYMKAQSAGKMEQLHMSVAGKTGTPERIWKGKRINDGWYVFFAPARKGHGHIVTCIRIEATKGSSDAVKLAGEVVIPKLLQSGWISGFETTGKGRVREVPDPE